MKIVRILAVVLLACLLPRAANAAIIESVSVNVLDRDSTSKVLLERMSASMQTVAEQLLLDKDTEKVEPVRSEYTRLLGEVGDRVLNGYQMEQVMLQLGTQTQVTMVVSPWNEVINDVFVDLQFSGVEEIRRPYCSRNCRNYKNSWRMFCRVLLQMRPTGPVEYYAG